VHFSGKISGRFVVDIMVSCMLEITVSCVLYRSVDTQLQVCVSDSALSRDVFPNDYHCLGDNENRPVKWLATEALVTRNFSTASDMVCARSQHVCHAQKFYYVMALDMYLID